MNILLYLAIACFAVACVLTGILLEKTFSKKTALNPYQCVNAIWFEVWRRPEEILEDLQHMHRCHISPLELSYVLNYLLQEGLIQHRIVPDFVEFGTKMAHEFRRTPPDFGKEAEPIIPLLTLRV